MNEYVEGSWGLYPWFEECGVDLVHSDDADEFRKLSPYGKVFLCTGEEDGFIKIAYGARMFRVKPDLFRSIAPIMFPIGTRVTIRDKEGDAVVNEIQWHHRDSKPIYFVRRNDKRDSRRYSSDDLANTSPNKAAKTAAAKISREQAERSAADAATLAIVQGGAFKMDPVDARTQNRLSQSSGSTGARDAKRMAIELDGLTEREFLEKMAGESCTVRTVSIDGPPPQAMRVYEYADGTVVRYKPLGDQYRNLPTYSVEVKKDPALPDLGKDSTAFKVDPLGRPVPKGPLDMKNPYPGGSLQADVFEEAILKAGHRTLRR